MQTTYKTTLQQRTLHLRHDLEITVEIPGEDVLFITDEVCGEGNDGVAYFEPEQWIFVIEQMCEKYQLTHVLEIKFDEGPLPLAQYRDAYMEDAYSEA